MTATDAGARMRCVFQQLEGVATPEGLWLTSTAANMANDRLRVTAVAVGRGDDQAGDDLERGHSCPLLFPALSLRTGMSTLLPCTGTVQVAAQTVLFTRPGLVEEYTVSLDGVRQDFILESPPLDLPPSTLHPTAGQLRLELAVTGAQVEPLANGARLVLDGSGRQLAYSRLRVTDANGRELPARMEVPNKSEVRNPESEMDLAVVVQDADAVYPVRIDPTFSDANWIGMNPGIPGVGGGVNAVAVDGSGITM